MGTRWSIQNPLTLYEDDDGVKHYMIDKMLRVCDTYPVGNMALRRMGYLLPKKNATCLWCITLRSKRP